MDKILYARVKDIVGPNAIFVEQSGAFPKRFNDFTEADNQNRLRREADISEQALKHEFKVPVTTRSKRILRVLGG